ncbi:MAG: methyl-accepting chemotaxis protein, partial [Lachnospiraceae bacterium]|nr:methyl-accepting chemotaxis protein [Lachnospiraceae bacterium]
MKDIKIKTRMIAGFAILIVLMIVNVVYGDMALKKIVEVDGAQEEAYVKSANTVSLGLLIVAIVITVLIAMSLLKAIGRSMAQLSSAAKDIALGRTNIELVKYANDEFGELVDDYMKVIENIKEQARIAEEVSHGNLTVQVVPKSDEDALNIALKKLVEDNLHTLSNISDAGSQVTVSSSQVASASQALAQGSTEQASAIEQITASIDEIADKT